LKLLGLGLLLILGYGLFTSLVYFRQEQLIFYPDFPGRQISSTPKSIGLSYQNVSFVTEDNVQLHGWYIPHPQEKAVALFCHGNAGNISHRLQSIQTMHELGLSVFIFDYRGYGQSEGKISESGTYQDAQAAWKYLTHIRHYQAEEILVWGRSLGAAIAANLAATQQAKAVIIESSFTSVPDLAAQLYPLLPVRWISRYQYDVMKSVKNIHRPILIVHSREDEIIPFKHGKQLFEAANEPKMFLEISGSHDAGIQISRTRYTKKLFEFINSL